MVVDVVTFNGEYDLWEIRHNVLKDVVDQFIVVEAPTTFSGKPKPLYFEKIKEQYPDVRYFVIDENYSDEEIALAESSPNTQGASHWKREFLQKESIKKALTHLKDDDIAFVGDVDEVYYPHAVGAKPRKPTKLKLQVYSYYLNNRSSEVFWGTVVAYYKDIKGGCLNHIRSTEHRKTDGYGGWHFTSMGGYDEVKRKLSDSYTRESYWTDAVESGLKDNLEMGRDFLGRGFTYKIDESELPQFLIDNKQKYAHLFR